MILSIGIAFEDGVVPDWAGPEGYLVRKRTRCVVMYTDH